MGEIIIILIVNLHSVYGIGRCQRAHPILQKLRALKLDQAFCVVLLLIVNTTILTFLIHK